MKPFLFLLSFVLTGCGTSRLPSVLYNQFSYRTGFIYNNDSLKITLGNPLHCPLRIWIQSPDTATQTRFNSINPVLLEANSDTALSFIVDATTKAAISFASRLGDPLKPIRQVPLELPFPQRKKYRIIQGNQTSYTHNTDWSRFAIDFGLSCRDTICSATDGFVVGLVDAYQHGGTEKVWLPYSNYITIYHPASGLFIQYVHLVYKGSLVRMGDPVKSGQPIALSGMTGQTNTAHLHFSCLVPCNSQDGLKSVPVRFTEGYQGTVLKAGDEVRK